MASVDELDFLIETHRIEAELVAAKAARDAGEDGAEDRVRAAKDAARAHRAFWRGIRAFIGAAPAPGDAVAAPDTHGMGITAQEG